MAAQNLDQLFVNDLDHLLGGRKRRQHFLAHRLLLDIFDELFDHPEIDVGLEQRHADFPQRRFHVFGRQFTFAAEIFENPLQLFREIVEH